MVLTEEEKNHIEVIRAPREVESVEVGYKQHAILRLRGTAFEKMRAQSRWPIVSK